jgi:hypothetical protein
MTTVREAQEARLAVQRKEREDRMGAEVTLTVRLVQNAYVQLTRSERLGNTSRDGLWLLAWQIVKAGL